MAKTKLKQLEVDEVSLVDAGANQHAHVMLYKNRSGEPGAGAPQQEEKPQSGLRRFFSAIGKALLMSDDDIEEAVESIEKADTFAEKMAQRQLCKIQDEIWDVCYALESSLSSILNDDEVVDKTTLMNQSVDEFTAAVKGMTAKWGAGTPAAVLKSETEIPAEHLQETMKRLESMLGEPGGIEKVDEGSDPEGQPETDPVPGGTEGVEPTQKSTGGNSDMKFREENMTPEDKAAFDDLKKRYGIEEEEDVTKGAPVPQGNPTPAPQAEGGDDIYKGINPVVKAELDAMKKRIAEADHEKMVGVAKKYQLLGKDPEELAKTLETLKAAGGTVYDEMISTLDASLAMVESSGMFGEVGKAGRGGTNGVEAVTKAETIAKKFMEADPTMNYAVALDMAFAQHPELVAEYEATRM